MARLATPVPRRRLRPTRPSPIRRPGLASQTPPRFSPYSAIFGPGGVVREPSDSVAEKLAPTHPDTSVPPPSKSGGNSGNLTVPGYTPATPTGAPYNPSEPGHSAADFKAAFAAKEQHEARRRLERQLGTLQPLKAPTATLPLIGPYGQSPLLNSLSAGDRENFYSYELGQSERGELSPIDLRRQSRSLLSKLPELPSAGSAAAPSSAQLVADRSVTVQTPRGPISVPQSAIAANPQDPLGPATLGHATIQQLVGAAKAGALRISKKGVLTTPENRQVLQRLVEAHRNYQRTARPGDLPYLSGEGEKNALTVLGVGAHRDESQKALLSAIETGLVESYGFKNLPEGDEDSEGWRQERTSLYGTQDPRNVKAGANNYFDEVRTDPTIPGGGGETPGQLAQTVQGSAYPERYAEHEAEAKEILRAFQQGQADPQAAQQLVQAKRAAVQHGINPTPWNGDVEGGDQEYVYVRADAKGAVNWAKSTLGTQEGSPKQRHWAELEALGPSEPWCADWVAVNLARRGVELPEGPNGSWNYESPNWKGGTQLGTDISKAKPGDLVVYGSGAHIAMYVGDGKVIAGNWGDEVAEYGATEDARGISAIVRPHYKGGRVKVKAGQLPGSSTESTFGGGVTGSEGSVGGATPAAASEGQVQGGGRTPQQIASAEAALAGFGPLAAPGFAAGVATPEFGGTGSAEELLALLTQAAGARATQS